mmetsp:Transcript_77403/g.146018  ORF Transcript_77403/g.146018 Transcript_77403/m.146018 type:complete len:236 (+) Transcript_77403:67-774(+)
MCTFGRISGPAKETQSPLTQRCSRRSCCTFVQGEAWCEHMLAAHLWNLQPLCLFWRPLRQFWQVVEEHAPRRVTLAAAEGNIMQEVILEANKRHKAVARPEAIGGSLSPGGCFFHRFLLVSGRHLHRKRHPRLCQLLDALTLQRWHTDVHSNECRVGHLPLFCLAPGHGRGWQRTFWVSRRHQYQKLSNPHSCRVRRLGELLLQLRQRLRHVSVAFSEAVDKVLGWNEPASKSVF